MSRSLPWILGIASSHNGGACLMHGRDEVVAIQEERLLRHKRADHPGAFPSLSIEYCLKSAGIHPDKLDAVVSCAALPIRNAWEDVALNSQLETARRGIPVFTIPHHMGHAVGAYALSGEVSAGILIVDGNGSPWDDLLESEKEVTIDLQRQRVNQPGRTVPRENVSIYIADQGVITPIEKHVASYPKAGSSTPGLPEFQTLGDMYGAVGRQIFGSFFEGPGKVMGLAPYGTPTIPVEEFLRITDGGFEFQSGVRHRFPHDEHWPAHQETYRDLAASVQRALEEAMLYLAHRVRKLADNLCYAGGVALNSVANERIVREAGFRSVYIMPAAEDSGTAFGAAYYGLWRLCGYEPVQGQRVDAFGHGYTREEITAAVDQFPAIRSIGTQDIVEQTAELLASGNIVGWFQGKSEMGPRALGQRSILCDPRSADMKDTLNQRVKFREGFRPFAPMIPEEAVYDWFDVTPPNGISPFMLRVLKFRAEQRIKAPAVVHIDGTGRVQTVSKDASPLLHRLVTVFGERTGVPILLNTSFNIAGEPIVETPEDALWCFLYTGIDYCVLDNQVITKSHGMDAVLDYPLAISSVSIALQADIVNGSLSLNVPSLSEVEAHAYSAHISRPDPIKSRMLVRDGSPLLKIVVRTRWGFAAHWVSGALFRILRLVDGRRTGREIFEDLLAAGAYAKAGGEKADSSPLKPSAPEIQFRRQLGLLRRVGAIGFNNRVPRHEPRDRASGIDPIIEAPGKHVIRMPAELLS